MGEIKNQIAHLATEGLMHAWDEMDAAAQRVQTAQGSQMTEACARLETARLQMRSAIQVAFYAKSVNAGARP